MNFQLQIMLVFFLLASIVPTQDAVPIKLVNATHKEFSTLIQMNSIIVFVIN